MRATFRLMVGKMGLNQNEGPCSARDEYRSRRMQSSPPKPILHYESFSW